MFDLIFIIIISIIVAIASKEVIKWLKGSSPIEIILKLLGLGSLTYSLIAFSRWFASDSISNLTDIKATLVTGSEDALLIDWPPLSCGISALITIICFGILVFIAAEKTPKEEE